MTSSEPRPPGEERLVDFISSITGEERLRIEENLPHGFVRLKIAEAERRQAEHDIRSVEDIVIELVRNSRDAGAHNVLVALRKESGRYRRITVLDDGCGIHGDMHQLIFEPRVTSKSEEFQVDRYGVHGRGMALFSIRSRAEDVQVQSSVPGKGTAIALTVDTSEVTERSDQATVPRLETVDGVEELGPGPHNVPRALLEMSVDSPGISLYMGSFAEVLATLRRLSVKAGVKEESLWQGLCEVDDARELMETSERWLGLPVSERSAYRVLKREIPPLSTIYQAAPRETSGAAVDDGPSTTPPRAATRRRNPVRRILSEDLEEIGSEASRAIEPVIGRYYMKTAGPPSVRRGRGKLIISIHVTGEDGDQQ